VRRIKVKQVDAFTTVPFGGNPAAVVIDAEGLTDEEMQRIAQEMNLSETAFVTSSERADFRVRFFTPIQEIDLAGHPTIATFHALVEEGLIAAHDGLVTVTQELNVGVLPIEIEIEAGVAKRVIMTQQKPLFASAYAASSWAEALGIDKAEILEGYPLQIVSTGTPQLMIPVKSLTTLRLLGPDFEAMTALTEQGDFSSVHVFTLETFSEEADVHARHFAPAAGVREDPVSSSASGSMAAYLVYYGLVDKSSLLAEQGHLIGRPGLVYIDLEKEGDEITMVKVGGSAVTVLNGEIFF
jgi:trans-2,3-dihydro-3-hydroxyanthranilate isomerase